MENLIKIGAAYLRVSDSRQDEYSPESQLKKIREEAQRDGVMIPDEYVFFDDGISGRDTKKRDEFNRMICIAKEKDSFEIIYVWKFSRFARNQEQSIVYKSLLARHGVAVKSVSEPLPEGPFGELIERILEWTDEYYSTRLSEEVKRGMIEKFSRGEPTQAPPFGYKLVDKRYIIDDENAEIVREIFERYANGEGAIQIATDIGNRGVRTKNGTFPESRWIRYIVNNQTYIGMIRRSEDRNLSKRQYNTDAVSLSQGVHEPIIERDLWERAQERQMRDIEIYGVKKRDTPSSYMCKGVIRCGNCGAAMSMVDKQKHGRAASLQCCDYAHGKCRVSHYVKLVDIETALIDGIEQAVSNQEFAFSVKQPEKEKKEIEKYDKTIAQLERALEKAKQAYLADVDTLDQYKENKTRLEAEISRVKALKENDQEDIEIDKTLYAQKIRGVVEFLRDDSVSIEAKNTAVRSIIEKAVFYKETRSLDIYFRQ